MAKKKKSDKVTYEAPVGRELGNPFAADSLFGDYESGKVFDYDQWSAKDMDEMLARDGKASTLEQVLCLPIRRAPWVIEPHDKDSGEAEFLTKFLEMPSNAGGMSVPFGHVIGQATSAFLMRKAFFEKVFRVMEAGELKGKVVYDKIAWRPTSSCQLARNSKTGAFAGFRQQPFDVDPALAKRNLDWINYQPNRSWVYIHGQHRNPMRGTSDLEVALWCYRTKQKIRYLWYSFLENQSLPKSIVTDKDLAQAKRVARDMARLKSQGVLAKDGNTEILPYESSGKGADQFQAAINFLNSEMSGSVLAGFTDLTSAAADGHGSFALSKDASDFFLASRYAVADELAESINHYLLSDLVTYNFGPEANAPQFKFTQLAEADIADAVNLLTSAMSATANNLPGEFTYMLAEKVGEYLDFDVDKLRQEFEQHAKEKQAQAEAMQKMQLEGHEANIAAQKQAVSKAGQVGRAAGAVGQAVKRVDAAKKGVKLSEDTGRTVIDLATKKPKDVILCNPEDASEVIDTLREMGAEDVELASHRVGGSYQHVPGTAYNWWHGYRPRNAATAIKYRKGRKVTEALQKKGKIARASEPDWWTSVKPGEKVSLKIGEGKAGDVIQLKIPTITKGDEGGSKLPFEGKAQKSKVAKVVLEELEKHYKGKGDKPEVAKAKAQKQTVKAMTNKKPGDHLQKLLDDVPMATGEKKPAKKANDHLNQMAFTTASPTEAGIFGMKKATMTGEPHHIFSDDKGIYHVVPEKAAAGYEKIMGKPLMIHHSKPSGEYTSIGDAGKAANKASKAGGKMSVYQVSKGKFKIGPANSSMGGVEIGTYSEGQWEGYKAKLDADGVWTPSDKLHKNAVEVKYHGTITQAFAWAEEQAKESGDAFEIHKTKAGMYWVGPTVKAAPLGSKHIGTYSGTGKYVGAKEQKEQASFSASDYKKSYEQGQKVYASLEKGKEETALEAFKNSMQGKNDQHVKAVYDGMLAAHNAKKNDTSNVPDVVLPGPGMNADGLALKKYAEEMQKTPGGAKYDAMLKKYQAARAEFKEKHGVSYDSSKVEPEFQKPVTPFMPNSYGYDDHPKYADAKAAGYDPVNPQESANGTWKPSSDLQSYAGAYHYSGGAYTMINAQLRKYKAPTGGSNDAAIAQMDKEFAAASPTSKNIVTTRRMTGKGPFPDIPPGAKSGATFKDWGYGSTSKDPEKWSGDVEMQVRIPAGTKVLDLNHTIGSQHTNEEEILLNRGTVYRVISDKMVGGKRMMVVEVTNNGG